MKPSESYEHVNPDRKEIWTYINRPPVQPLNSSEFDGVWSSGHCTPRPLELLGNVEMVMIWRLLLIRQIYRPTFTQHHLTTAQTILYRQTSEHRKCAGAIGCIHAFIRGDGARGPSGLGLCRWVLWGGWWSVYLLRWQMFGNTRLDRFQRKERGSGLRSIGKYCFAKLVGAKIGKIKIMVILTISRFIYI